MEFPASLDALKSEVFQLLLGLLPGFLTVAIITALTVRQRLSPFERIVQALIYTFVIHMTWQVILASLSGINRIYTGDPWTPSAATHLLALAVGAVFWGLVTTWLVNEDWLHAKLRKWRITKRASRPNVWYDAFYRTLQFVVVHLKDRRRIYGWPSLYPERPNEGHLFLTQAQWLMSDSDAPTTAGLELSTLIPVTDVVFVEFVPPGGAERGQ